MKTILQIARELGVSKQAVYKRFRGKLYTEVSPYVHTKDGTAYISEQGENIIKQDFLKDNPQAGVHTEPHTEPDTERIQDTPPDIPGAHTDILIKMLQKELEIKNKQIEELAATVRIQAESINAQNHNKLAETIIDGQNMPLIEPKKERFFNKWRKRQSKKHEGQI